MTHIIADRVKETSNTTGLADTVLAGEASNFRAFSAVCANNDTVYVAEVDQAGGGWQVYLGTYKTSTNAIVHTTFLASSTGAFISWSAGTRDVFITLAASRIIGKDATRAEIEALLDISSGWKGLYRQVMSATPTSASTGLTTWGNQAGATVADTETGIYLYGSQSTNNASIRYKAAPTPPYSVDVLLERFVPNTNSLGVFFGFYDGTKIQCFALYDTTLYVLNYTSITASASSSGILASKTHASSGLFSRTWLRIRDDGTNASFSVLPGGAPSAAHQIYSAAKSGGYLSAFSNVFFGVNRSAEAHAATLLSYTERAG